MGASVERLEFDANASKVLAEYAKVIAESKNLTTELQKGAKEAVKGSAEASAGLAAQAKAVIEATAREKELKNAISEVNKQRMAGGLAVSTAIAQLKRLETQEQLLQKEVNQTTTAFLKSGEQSSAALDRQVAHLAAVQKQMTHLRTVIGGAGAQFGQFGASAGQANANITQLSFAADDFFTVLQMNNYSMHGWISGLRSAGNNLSFVLASINPLYAIIPSLGTALAAFVIPRLFETAKASEEAGKSSDIYRKSVTKLTDELYKLERGEKAAQAATEERGFGAEMMAQIQSKAKLEEELQAAELNLANIKQMGVPMAASLPGAEERVKTARTSVQAAQARTQKMIEDRGRVVEARQKADQEESASRSFKRDNAAVMERAGTRYSSLSAEIKKRAGVGFAQGLSEQEVISSLSPVMAAGFNEGEQEAVAGKFFEDIAAAQQENALAPKKSAGEARASGLRQQLRELSAEKAAAVAAAPRNKLSGVQERGFRERGAPAQAELAAIEAKNAAAKGEMTDGLKNIADGIDTLIKIASGKNGARPIARNGGQ